MRGTEYWDSNDGKNYAMQLCATGTASSAGISVFNGMPVGFLGAEIIFLIRFLTANRGILSQMGKDTVLQTCGYVLHTACTAVGELIENIATFCASGPEALAEYALGKTLLSKKTQTSTVGQEACDARCVT